VAFANRRVSSKLRPKWGTGITVGQFDDESMLVKWPSKDGETSIEFNEDLNWHDIPDGAQGSRTDNGSGEAPTTADEDQRGV
jgi:hypothetical protein